MQDFRNQNNQPYYSNQNPVQPPSQHQNQVPSFPGIYSRQVQPNIVNALDEESDDETEKVNSHSFNDKDLEPKKNKFVSAVKSISSTKQRESSNASSFSSSRNFFRKVAQSYKEIIANGKTLTNVQRIRQQKIEKAKRLGMTTDFY